MLENRCIEALKEMFGRLLVYGLTEEEQNRYSEAVSVSIRLLNASLDSMKNHKFNKEWGK